MLHIKFGYILFNHSCGLVIKRYTLISPIGPRLSGPWEISTFIYTLISVSQGILHKDIPFSPYLAPLCWPLEDLHLRLFKN